jgi:exopolysaccharide biosynthesis polyprenyl glycosylphosphotransferase
MLQHLNSKTRGKAIEKSGRPSIGWAILFLIIVDVVCVVLSTFLAFQLRFEWMRYQAPFSEAFYTQLMWVAVPIFLVVLYAHHLYDPENLFGGLREYAGVFSACTVGTLGLVLYSFFIRPVDQDISRGWLAMVWLFSVVSITCARFGYRRGIYYLRKRGLFTRRVLVVGASEEGRMVARQLCDSPATGIKIIGFIDSSFAPGMQVEGVEVLGGLTDVAELIDRWGVDELIAIPTALGRDALLKLYRDWGTDEHVCIRLSSGLYELFTTGVSVREVGCVPLLTLSRTRITGLDAVMKVVLDYVGALVLVILLLPVFLLIALSVWVDSGRPIIYLRRVVGLSGREFDAYKFRTMVVDADAYLESHPELNEEWKQNGKIQNDPRITRVGRFLRRWSLDELLQLFNVLRGQMSLVGPRMLTPGELDHFGRWRHNLLTVKPGLTGLWQISGRADLSYEDRVRLDMQYVRNYSIWLDLQILLNTLKVVIRRRGAY